MPLGSPSESPFIPCYNNEGAAGADWPVILGQVGVEAADRAFGDDEKLQVEYPRGRD